jgi:hypothetical protein
MTDEETMESTEQPQLEDSTPDQPDVSPEEGETVEDIETEEPTEESEPTVEINGEEIPISELKQGYMRQSDYTRKTQELANLRKTNAPKQELTDEQKQIQEFIKSNNLMTTAQFNQIQADNNDIASLKGRGMTAKQEQILRSLSKSTGTTSTGVPFYQASMTEIYDDVFDNSEKPKVISKKVVGVKPKSGDRVTGKLTREMIANMSQEEYMKRQPEIIKAMKDGTL